MLSRQYTDALSNRLDPHALTTNGYNSLSTIDQTLYGTLGHGLDPDNIPPDAPLSLTAP
ncbi:MAG TPA: hypothetical protein VKY85_19010 [Candidatus Angelobacter sp.]|nr:hypothetical protein [Candidatus Angelobacter sp.]